MQNDTEREGSMSSSSQGLNFIDTGKFVAWFSHQKRLGHDEFSEREQFSDISGSNESIFRDVDPMSVAKFFFKGVEILLTQARSESMKQEHTVESLNN